MICLPYTGLKISHGMQTMLKMWVWDFVQGTITLPVSAGMDDETGEGISS